ncbi:MAG: hypothetical protein ACYTG5_11015 [Planctomycetota bacterium]|jgi:hypothetical protein
MKQAASLAGPVLVLVGLGMLVYGLLRGHRVFTYVGAGCLLVGVLAGFKKQVCPNCGKSAWTSGGGITHCQVCGAPYAGDGDDTDSSD